MVDDHDAPAGEHAGEGHPAGERGVDLLAGGAEQVHAPVAGAPRVVGRVEPLDDLGLWPQRPLADRVLVGRAESRGRAEQGQHLAQDDGQREPGKPGRDGGETLHGGRFPGGGDLWRTVGCRLWRRRAAEPAVDSRWRGRTDSRRARASTTLTQAIRMD